MKIRRSRLVVCSILFSMLACPLAGFTQRNPPPNPIVAAKAIEEGIDNGIFVDQIKVYDDISLQNMLNAARARLALLSGFDQNALISKIGAVTGATVDQRAIAAQVLGPPIPGSTITSNGATGSTQSTNGTTSGTSSSTGPTGTTNSTTGGSTQNVVVNSGLPVTNTVTNNPQQNPAVPPPPSLSAALPTTGYSVSSIDALNEMMQLTYEITNLQLMLEGSLTDRYAYGSRYVKPRTTLGFPITITPGAKYKDAVAFVEVEAINPYTGVFNPNEKPTVTALLPREKTYNVASITDHMTSLGGGVVSQVFNAGFSFLHGHKTYYLVQDQDTIATMKNGTTPLSTAFSWQFRPVMGQSFVKPGMKETFVQLAAPLNAATACFGGIKITTYWRKYDTKKGILKEVIPDSIRADNAYQPIPVYDQKPVIANVDYDDLGNGQVQVMLSSQLPSGTRIKVGNNIYGEGSPGFSLDQRGVRFIASVSDLARYRAYILARNGDPTEMINNQPALHAVSTQCQLTPAPLPALAAPAAAAAGAAGPASTVSIEGYDIANSTVTITLGSQPTPKMMQKYMVNIGGQVYGLSTAPIERIGVAQLRVVVPNTVLQTAPFIDVGPLFYTVPAADHIANPFFNTENAVEKIVVFDSLGGASGGHRYLLYGSRLDQATIVAPSGVALTAFPGYGDIRTLQMFQLTMAQEKDLIKIYIQKGNRRPIAVAMPGGAPKTDDSAKPLVTVTVSTPQRTP